MYRHKICDIEVSSGEAYEMEFDWRMHCLSEKDI